MGDRVKGPYYLTYINTTGDVMSTQKSTAKDAVKTLSDFSNVMCLERTEFAKEVMREHKTLQQNIFSLFLRTIEEWSEQSHFDSRNEFTVNKSKEIMKLFPHGTQTPFI